LILVYFISELKYIGRRVMIALIVTKISDLERKQFYIDGGRSIDEFNMLGDDGAKFVEDTIEQLEKFSSPCDEENFD
jgi:hypothetical protein